MALALLSARFQSLPLLPTIKLGPSSADSRVSGLVQDAPVSLSNKLSCEAGSFSCCHLNPPRVFSIKGLRLYFPELEPWVARSALLLAVHPNLSMSKCGAAGYDPPLCLPLSLPL